MAGRVSPRHSDSMRFFRLVLFLPFLAVAGPAGPDWPVLLKQMDSEKFAERSAATKVVEQWASQHEKEALKIFPRKIRDSRSPEIRERLTAILREIYIPETRSLFGFQYLAKRSPSPQGNTRTILEIEFVMGQTAAALGGLKQGDLITAINGKAFDPRLNDDELQDFFFRMKAGKATLFGILREGNKLNLTLTPKNQRVTALEKAALKERFNRWLSSAIEDLPKK